MKLHPRLSRAAVTLASRFETFHAEAQPLPEGGWTVGYGHTSSAREGVRVSRADAEALLLYDLSHAADTVAGALYAPASQRQFEALTAFAFNIGAENFRASSALAAFNAGQELEAADEIERWRAAELGSGAQVVDALVRRRAAEKAHFLGLPEGFAKTTSAMVRPLPTDGLEPAAAAPAVQVSALRLAAESIQARLRSLVPEPEAAPAPEGGPEAPPFPEPEGEPSLHEPPLGSVVPQTESSSLPASSPAVIPPSEDTLAAPQERTPASEDLVTVVPANDVHAPEPPPPAPPPPPPPEPDPPTADLTPPRAEPAAAVASPVEAVSPDLTLDHLHRRPSARAVHILLVALGAAMFVAAVVLILGGRPTLPSLVLGLLGAAVLTPGVYGLLGPKPAA